MKILISAGSPVFAILLSAVILLGGGNVAMAQTAITTETPVVETQVVTPDSEVMVIEKSSGTLAGEKAPAFQGLIPPAGNVVTYGTTAEPNGEDTHPMIRITPDKSELVRLETDASSIIVGNPDHLGVLMDNRRLLILVPRAPGATYMTVLDSAGNVIMQRHIIVASPKSDYIRIRRSCAGQGSDCQATSVYYCPGMCHQVGLVTSSGSGEIAPIASSGPPSANENDAAVDVMPAQENAVQEAPSE
ncbi:MAG: pilus assembly protein N-terminal domain-containing protein [Micavibrio sp.]